MASITAGRERSLAWLFVGLAGFALGAACSQLGPAFHPRQVFNTLATSRRRKLSRFTRALAALEEAFPADQISQDPELLRKYGSHPGTFALPIPPSVIVFGESKEDVQQVVKIATTFGIVVIPVAGRTSLEGQFLPPTCCDGVNSYAKKGATSAPTKARPTIHLCLARMNKVVSVHPADFNAVVEPGVGWQSLNAHLQGMGVEQFFPVDPAPGSQFGGMVGVGGSGTNAVGYGTMRGEWICGLEVVLMDGSVIRTKGDSRARKSSTGWDVGRLFLGAEGTLGIITQLSVRLAPVVPLRVALTSFPDVAKAVDAVVDILGAGLSPTSLELLDGMSIRGLNLAKLLPEALEERPTVLMRFSSPLPAVITASMDTVNRIVQKHGGKELTVAKNSKENEDIWKARKNQFWSQQLLIGEGCRTLITDVCVPISRLAEFVARSEVDVAKSGLLAPIVSHIGDGNVHRAILFKADPNSTEAPPAVAALATALSKLAIELEGTCAGEHGIGVNKRKYLTSELGEGTMKVMRDVKKLLDPQGLLNPGKILYEDGEDE